MSSSNISFTRLFDNQCCLYCQKAIQPNQDGARVTVPTKVLSKIAVSTYNSFIVKWNKSKTTDFLHWKCWETIKSIYPNKSKSLEIRILKEVEEYIEKFSCYEVIEKQVQEAVDLMLAARRVVCFSGAGISASAGLSTYRGTDGIDTQDQLAEKKKKNGEQEEEEEEEEQDVDYTILQPTFTHKALVELHEIDKMHYIATQNCDDLHQKAGITDNLISDLHGNVFLEYCEKCFTQYRRDYCVDLFSTDCYNESWYKKCRTCGLNHYTGRHCEKGRCNGKLKDTIVNFGDDLHEFICGGLRMANLKCKTADVCWCLGSSLCVFPACELPLKSQHRIIINLQATDLDDDATIRVWGTTDSFFQLFMPAFLKAIDAAGKTKGKSKAASRAKAASAVKEEEEEKPVNKGKKRSANKVVIDSDEEAEFEPDEPKKVVIDLVDSTEKKDSGNKRRKKN